MITDGFPFFVIFCMQNIFIIIMLIQWFPQGSFRSQLFHLCHQKTIQCPESQKREQVCSKVESSEQLPLVEMMKVTDKLLMSNIQPQCSAIWKMPSYAMPQLWFITTTSQHGNGIALLLCSQEKSVGISEVCHPKPINLQYLWATISKPCSLFQGSA